MQSSVASHPEFVEPPWSPGSTLDYATPSSLRAEASGIRALACPTGWVLFVLLNAALFIRPGEIVPGLEEVSIFAPLLVLCLIASVPVILQQLTTDYLAARPGMFCIICLLPAIALSNLVHLDFYDARIQAFLFLEVVAYYLLLCGLVNSASRLSFFLVVICIFVCAIATLSLLDYYKIIHIEALSAVEQWGGVNSDGDVEMIQRLQGPGIFNDPNDFSLVLVLGMVVSLHLLLASKNWLKRFLWVLPLALLGYALQLTLSRGGLLSLLGGASVLLISRFGWRRFLPIAVVFLPLIFLIFGGRQTSVDLDDGEDTAQGRVQIWKDCFILFHHAPLFGIGAGRLADENELVAHNSYVHAFTELGALGGTIFIGAIYIPLSILKRSKAHKDSVAARDVLFWRPCIMAIVAGYAVGMYSLSRSYALPTYLVLGIAGVYCNLLAAHFPESMPRVTRKLAFQLAKISFGCLVFLHLFIYVFAR